MAGTWAIGRGAISLIRKTPSMTDAFKSRCIRWAATSLVRTTGPMTGTRDRTGHRRQGAISLTWETPSTIDACGAGCNRWVATSLGQ